MRRGVAWEKDSLCYVFCPQGRPSRTNQQASGQSSLSPEMESLANSVDWLLALAAVSVINMPAPHIALWKKRGVA